MAGHSSRGRSSSPFGYRKPPSTSYSSTSSTASASSFMNGRLIPRSSPSSVSSHFPRSVTPNRGRSDLSRNRSPMPMPPMPFPSAEELLLEAESSRGGPGDSISVTVRFRPLRFLDRDLVLDSSGSGVFLNSA